MAISTVPQCASASSLVSSYELTGSFRRNAERQPALAWSRPHDPVDAFDSAGGGDAGVGSLRTGVFQAPAVIHFFVSGMPSLPGLRIYLLDEARNRTIDLTMRPDPGDYWTMHYWTLPKAWQGVRVRLIAEDKGTAKNDWLGLTLPESGSQTVLVSVLRAGLRNGLLAAFGLLFLLPGVAGCALLSRLGIAFDLRRAVGGVMVCSSLCALSIFGLYLLNPTAGKKGSLLVMGAGSLVLLTMRRRLFAGETALRRELTACLAAVLLAGTFVCSLGYLYTTDAPASELAQARYQPSMPPDNVLPQMLADRLYAGKSVLPSLFNYWHSSDRPPLETAIDLMEKPFFPARKDPLTYQSLGIFLQCTWVAGVWVLLRTAGLGMRHVAFAVAFCLLSYFCILHGFYIWAKLLSSTFCLLGLSFFPFIRAKNSAMPPKWTPLDAGLAGAALAFGMLCHPGVGFTFGGIFFVAAYTRSLPALRPSLAGAASAAVVLLPWVAYQKFYDPPGDNLLKAHLAGVIDFQHSLAECIVTAYRNLTFEQWVLNKTANVLTLFSGDHGLQLVPWNTERVLKEFLASTFYFFFCAAGVLNAGFAVRMRRLGDPGVLRLAGRLLTITAVSLGIWCLVMFDPGSTLVHQGSFANVLLLFAGLSLWLLEGAPKLAAALLGVQAFVIFPVLVFTWPLYNSPGTLGDAPPDAVMALCALLSLAALALVFRCVWRVPALQELTAGNPTDVLPLRMAVPVVAHGEELAWQWLPALFLAAVVAVISRRPDAVFSAQFHAEDGVVWFADAYNLGFLHALIQPHTGYFQTFPRLAAALSLGFPLGAAPLVMNLVGIAVQVLPSVILLSSRCAGWASLPVRAAMAFTCLAIPGGGELNATVDGSQWYIALAACLLAVSAPPSNRSWRAFDLTVYLLSGLTGPFCIILLPIAAFLWWLRRGAWRLAVVCLLSCTGVLQLLALAGTAAAARASAPLGASVESFVQIVGGQIFIGAIFGSNHLAMIDDPGTYRLLAATAAIGMAAIAYCVALARLEYKLLIAFAVLVACASLKNPLVSLESPQWDVLKRESAARYWLFPMLALAWSLIWCVAATRLTAVRIAAGAVLCIMPFGIASGWRHKPYEDVGFPKAVQAFDAAPPGTRLIIPAYPRQWKAEIIKRSPSCGPVPFGAIQQPPAWARVSGRAVVSGYALAGKPLSHLSLYVDHDLKTSFVNNGTRSDVDGAFPSFPGGNKGFETTLDFSALSPGYHEIEVRAFIPRGCEAEIGAIPIAR